MNNTLKVIESLKSVRQFSDKNVSKEDLTTILKSCVKAASASARQAYSIIVIDNKDLMKEIGVIGNKVLVFCVDFNRIIDTAKYMGFMYNEITMADFVTGGTDTVLAAQTAVIAAKSLAIDSLFSNCVHRGNINRIYKLLNLPNKYCFPLVALAIGYSKKCKSKLTKKGRLKGSGVIHFNKYKRLNTQELDDIIIEYDNENKHFLSLISDWREKGYKHYLEYFYEKWCGFSRRKNLVESKKAKSNDIYSSVEDILIKSGFLLNENLYENS